jgi:LytTr DNA-binding domain
MKLQADDQTSNAVRRRTLLEALAWTVLVTFLWTVDTIGKIYYRNTWGIGKDNFRLISDQVTSAIAVLILVLFVVHWLRLFPIQRDRWLSVLIGHIVGSALFAFFHMTLMIVFRSVVFFLVDATYYWKDGFATNLLLEYQKDIKIYLGIIAIVSGYRFFRRSRDVERKPPAKANRLLVQTGAGEAVLRYEQIDYLEAARNYVSVHADGKEYLVRDTIANIEQELSSGPFARSHRSYVVNLDKVAEVRSVDGSLKVRLTTGALLPLSRGYRDGFREAMKGV